MKIWQLGRMAVGVLSVMLLSGCAGLLIGGTAVGVSVVHCGRCQCGARPADNWNFGG